ESPQVVERRTVFVHAVRDEDVLLVTLETELTPAEGRPALRLGSPLIAGRPNAGYSGLSLRFQRSLNKGQITLSTGESGPESMGKRAAWLHYQGMLDGGRGACGIAVFDHPNNPRHPTHFFVRNEPYGKVNPAFCWDEEFELAAGETLNLKYGVMVHSGAM